MKKVTIAFDVDGTLISNVDPDAPVKANVRIVVWSGGGEVYARQIAGYIGIKPYVDAYGDKNLIGQTEDGSFIFEPGFKPDIAIDDIQSCDLGILNLIVREK